MIYRDQAELDAALTMWQKRLRLQDWRVIGQTHRQIDVAGRCHFKLSLKAAVIDLLDPVDAVDWDYPLDHERTLVHELLHLHFAHTTLTYKDGSLPDLLMEQAIESLAGAFVEAYKEDRQ